MAVGLTGYWSDERGFAWDFHADGTVTLFWPGGSEAGWSYRVGESPSHRWIREKFPSPTGLYLVIEAPPREGVLRVVHNLVIEDAGDAVIVLRNTGIDLRTREPLDPPRAYHRGVPQPVDSDRPTH